MRVKRVLRDEGGFWSAIFILVLTSLAALGFSTYSTVRIEGANSVSQAQMLRADYAATSGAYMALKMYKDGIRTASQSVTVQDGISAAITIGAAGNYDQVTSSATYSGTQKKIKILLNPNLDLKDMAVLTTGDVSRVAALDSNRVLAPRKLKANADSIPTIREDSLRALSTAQGHNKFGSWTAPDGYLGSFMHASGKPNVTWINGDLT
jgi:hypothetical protein